MSAQLKMTIWNSRGVRNKQHELFNFLALRKIQLCLLSETWLDSNVSISNSDFYCYRNDRTEQTGGGVAILIKKGIKHQLLPIINTTLIENIGLRLFLQDGISINVYAIYFPGGSAGAGNVKKLSFAADLHKLTACNSNVIVGGDFNSRHQMWNCAKANCWGNILHEKLNQYNINIMYPCDPTYVPTNRKHKPSTLDFFVTNVPQKLNAPTVINDLASDHLPVECTLESFGVTVTNKISNFSKADWGRFKAHISRHLQSSNLETTNQVDESILSLEATIKAAVDLSVPKIDPQSRSPSKFPSFITNMIKARNFHRRNWQRTRTPYHKVEMRRLNDLITSHISTHRNKSWNNHLQGLDKGSPPFWNITKVVRKKSENIPSLKDQQNRYITCEEKCEILARTFKTNHEISSTLGDAETKREVNEVIQNFNNQSANVDNSYLIDTGYIVSILKTLKNKKAPGIDGVNNQCLKNLPKQGLKVLTKIVNACLKLKYFPSHWKISKVIAIHKPNKPKDSPSSYRPISLLSSISKILEKVVKDKLTEFIEENNVIPPQQFGFRREHNTIQPLVRIKNLVNSKFESGESTGMVLLDIQAAFDSVWHEGLIFKMIKCNFPTELIKIVQNYLTNRSFRVHIGSSHSSVVSVPAGCPQGSCLSPILYNIFTADIPVIENITTSVFADDTALLCSDVKADSIINNLESSLMIWEQYLTKWKIKINSTKTQAIFFTRKRKACFVPQRSLRFNNTTVNWEEHVKYLGVMLDKKLKFKEHISYVTNKINITTRVLYPFINRTSKLSVENKLVILKVIFHAIMFYGAPVWSSLAACHQKKLQITQNKLLKLMYNLPWHYSTARLHNIDDIPLVHDKLLMLTENFEGRCSRSLYPHISQLVIPSLD